MDQVKAEKQVNWVPVMCLAQRLAGVRFNALQMRAVGLTCEELQAAWVTRENNRSQNIPEG